MGDKHCNKWKWKTDLMTFSSLSSWQIHLSFVKYVIIEAIEDYSCSNLPPQKELKSEIRPNNRIRFKIYYLINIQGLTCNQAFREACRIGKVDRKQSQKHIIHENSLNSSQNQQSGKGNNRTLWVWRHSGKYVQMFWGKDIKYFVSFLLLFLFYFVFAECIGFFWK